MKAKSMRYKHPLVSDLNIEKIRERLEEMIEECGDVRWICNDEQTGLDALEYIIGDRDEAFELLTDFSGLSYDCERMFNDLNECWIPDQFDDLMCAVYTDHDDGDLYGFDKCEGDYYGLDTYEKEWAIKESKERMMRMTKSDLIDAMQQSMSIALQFKGIMYRYDCLKAAIDILRDEFGGQLETVKEIERLYDSDDYKTDRQFESLVKSLPDEAWIQ